MTRPQSWPKPRSCLTLFFHSSSTRWPALTRPGTDALLFLCILFAVAQLGLCIAMAHRLLSSPREVQCWNVSSNGDFDFSGFGLGSSAEESVLRREMKGLPVTYANLDSVFGTREGVGEGMGPEYLSAGEVGGSFTIVATLIFNPLLLVVDLLLLLRSHYRTARITNRAGMLWSTCFAVYFILVALGAVWLNSFPNSKIDDSYDTCWQYDKTMNTLEGWSRWAKGIVRGCEVLGLLGASCMTAYFALSLAAGYMNQRTDAQQSMRLDDLSSSSSTMHTENSRDFPSSGLGASAAPIQMNNFGITFIDATPASGGQQPKITRSQADEEGREAHANPFTDPENLLREAEGEQGDLVQDAEIRQWR